MTQHNLTQILKVSRDFVMRNRPCYRDYLGSETTTKTVQIGSGVFVDDKGIVETQFPVTDSAFTGFVLGETYTVSIDGVTADYVARNFSPISDGFGPIIGTATTFDMENHTFDGWICAAVRNSDEKVACWAQTFDMSFVGKTISISQTRTETVERYKTKLLPEYLLPAFLRKNVVASKTEVQSAADKATAAADAVSVAQSTADAAQSTATAAQSEIDLVNTKLQYVVNVTPQSLSDIQKTTARSNIGASDGNYNNLENAPCFSKNEATNYEQADGDMGTSLQTDAKKLFLSRKNVLLGKRLTAETLASFRGVTSTSAILFESDYSKPQVIENLIYQGVPTLAWGNLSLIRPSLTNTGEDWCVVVRTDTYYFYYWAQADNRCQFIYESILEHKLKQLDDSLIPDTIQRVPTGGTAGQLLGKTESGTAWIDPPQSGVQPDWNQNDETQPDYVKNRPFYTGNTVETVLVEESTVTFADTGSGYYMARFLSNFVATGGETYKVSWDGTVYECTCTNLGINIVIGNLSIAGAGSDTGEPFFMIVYNGEGIEIHTADTSASHTFSISGIVEPIVKIPAKFIDKDASGYIAIHKNSTMTGQEAQNYNRAISAGEVVFIIWGSLCINNISLSSGTGSDGASFFDLVLRTQNEEVYKIAKNNKDLFDLSDCEFRSAQIPGKKTTGDAFTTIYADKNRIRILPGLSNSGVGSTDVLFQVEPNGAKSKAFDVLGNGEAVAPALILYSSTANSTKKFKITVDDTGTLKATEVT